MSRNKDGVIKKKLLFSSLMENNKIVFLFSLIISVICWCGVSIYQTPVIEKVFNDVKVNINMDESLPKNSGLEIFGKKDFTVDVTVKGFSYIVNAPSFKDENIVVNASCSSVATAGAYDLPLSASLVGNSGNTEVVDVSVQSIKVTFDERITKSFGLVEDIKELEDYSLAVGFVRENPRLSIETLKLSGPAREMLKITSVKAHIELGGELKSTERYEAEIIAEGASGQVDLSEFIMDIKEPIYITVPVAKMEKFATAVDFSGIPQAYKESGVQYTVYPSEISLSLISDSNTPPLTKDNQILIGTIDFSKINNTVNKITKKCDNSSLDIDSFTVMIDMSSMDKRWLEVPVELSDAEIPGNVRALSSSVKSVQIIGPRSSIAKLDSSAAYAVPELKDIKLTRGKHEVPAKIILRTLKDSWVYGEYKLEIEVK